MHTYYSQLTDNERKFVDSLFSRQGAFGLAAAFDVPLAGDDRIERAVDAMARVVIESRKG